jgi:nucleoside-diphosphate-sugar epimerase
MVDTIIDISGKTHLEPKILATRASKGELTNQSLDSEKANARLGWRNEWRLREGLERTYRWYERFLSEKRG